MLNKNFFKEWKQGIYLAIALVIFVLYLCSGLNLNELNFFAPETPKTIGLILDESLSEKQLHAGLDSLFVTKVEGVERVREVLDNLWDRNFKEKRVFRKATRVGSMVTHKNYVVIKMECNSYYVIIQDSKGVLGSQKESVKLWTDEKLWP